MFGFTMRVLTRKTPYERCRYVLTYDDRLAIAEYFEDKITTHELAYRLGVQDYTATKAACEVVKQWMRAHSVPKYWVDPNFEQDEAEI